jgi:hypothetical protein
VLALAARVVALRVALRVVVFLQLARSVAILAAFAVAVAGAQTAFVAGCALILILNLKSTKRIFFSFFFLYILIYFFQPCNIASRGTDRRFDRKLNNIFNKSLQNLKNLNRRKRKLRGRGRKVSSDFYRIKNSSEHAFFLRGVSDATDALFHSEY